MLIPTTGLAQFNRGQYQHIRFTVNGRAYDRPMLIRQVMIDPDTGEMYAEFSVMDTGMRHRIAVDRIEIV